ncbi:MAG: Trk system potassium transporter TrkA [Verrucomicrobiota bacterium]
MNIIIVGAGEIGRHIATSLSSAAHNIVVIESDEHIARDLDSQIDARVLHADGSSAQSLIEVNIAECDLFMALTSSNNVNFVACSIAKTLGATTTISRVDPDIQREEWLFDYKTQFGADFLFSSERLTAVELSKFIRNPDSILVEEIARGKIELQQVILSDRSEAVGKNLRDVDLPERVRVASIGRHDEAFIPTADEVLEAGDRVTLFGEPRKLNETVEMLQAGKGKEKPISIVILGGGDYGFSLAQLLESWNCRLRIFEVDDARCELLTNELSRTTVINADATSLTELKEESVGDADFFIATTHSDEDNVMTCLQASNLGTKHCLTLIHRVDYADAISQAGSQLGVLAAVSPREATRRELMRFITSEKCHTMKRLAAGQIIETTVPKGSKVAGNKISEIGWPPGSVLVAVMHGIHAKVPAAEDTLAEGDTVYAMVSSKAKKKFLKAIGH